MTICARCTHALPANGRVNWRCLASGPAPIDRVTGRRRDDDLPCCAFRNDGRPEYGPSGDCPKFERRPEVEALEFEDFERGIVSPLWPQFRAWLRGLFAQRETER